MSRVGKNPVALPTGVTLTKGSDRKVTVKGPKGSLDLTLRPEVEVDVEGASVLVKQNGTGGARAASAYHGMTRAMISNMVDGVTKGYEKRLEIVGVGWKASTQGSKIVMSLGFCHPVELQIPKGISVTTPSETMVVISGVDKQAVGQMAAMIRAQRKPEPYKGKGVRYTDEVVRRKSGKSFGS